MREGAGRPPIPIDPEKLEHIVSLGGTCLECASEFKCSEDTIQRFVEERYGTNFAAFRDYHHAKLQTQIRQAQVKLAMGYTTKKNVKRKRKHHDPKLGVVIEEFWETIEVRVPPNPLMLKWLGVQVLGQTDRVLVRPDALKALSGPEPLTLDITVKTDKPIETLTAEWVDQEKPHAED